MSKKAKQVELMDPSPALVLKYVQEFEAEKYSLPDQAIINLFQLLPHNKDSKDILLKLSVVNALYGTRILATLDMAKHIQNLNIDPELAKHSTEIVNKIADLSIASKRIRFFSFATKYCSWHDQEQYPMYDSFVEKIIIAYNNRDGFAQFKRKELRDYTRFKEIMESFRRYYNLKDFGFKKLDHFLWLYGKEKFPNNYLRHTPAR